MSASTFKLEASDYAIKSVTVFKSSKAEVVRTFSLDLKKGQNKIEIRGLSSTIDTQTVRVSGLGDARLFDVTCTCESSKAASYVPGSAAEIKRALLVKKAALESERAVRDQESKLLLNYAETLTGEHVTPTQMGLFLETYVEKGRKTLQAVTKLNEEIVEITRQIDLDEEKAIAKHGTAFGKVDIVIVADADCSADLKLTYIVSQVQWTPTYELHATTESGKPSSSVSLHYRARVRQSTGEDWNNTMLTLSTVASDTVVKRIPQLRPVKVQPKLMFKKGPGFAFTNNNTTQNLFGPSNNVNTRQIQQQPFQQQPFQQASTFGPNKGGLFGQQQQPLEQQPQQPSLFAGRGGLFGQQQQAQHQQGSIFGGGGALFGSSQASSALGSGINAPTPQGFAAYGAFSNTHAAASEPSAVNPQLLAQYQQELAYAEAAPLPEEDEFEELDQPGAITEPTTVVSETPIAISFSVHGESTIPSDGVEHQVSVAVLPFEATISYICIPRIDPRVYLQCVVKNSSEYRLLPGPVTVIFDDSYVSKTSINDINTGDNFECTLGDDASTKVTYARTAKTVKSDGGAFSEVTNTTTYKTKISIHNKHQFAITDLVVREVIPTCEDKRATIVLRKPAGLADAKDGETVDLKDNGLRVAWEGLVDGKGGEKEGRFEWKWKVGSGAKVNLEAEWEVKVPGEEAWMEAQW